MNENNLIETRIERARNIHPYKLETFDLDITLPPRFERGRHREIFDWRNRTGGKTDREILGLVGQDVEFPLRGTRARTR